MIIGTYYRPPLRSERSFVRKSHQPKLAACLDDLGSSALSLISFQGFGRTANPMFAKTRVYALWLVVSALISPSATTTAHGESKQLPMAEEVGPKRVPVTLGVMSRCVEFKRGQLWLSLRAFTI